MNRKDKKLEYLYKCYRRGLSVTQEELIELDKAGYDIDKSILPPKVESYKEDKPRLASEGKKIDVRIKRDYTVIKSDEEIQQADKSDVVLTDEEYDYYPDVEERVESEIVEEVKGIIIKKGFGVETYEWKPKSVIYHTKEFYAWIDSINSGWENRIPYEPFNLYCQQADDWISLNEHIHQYETFSEKKDFVLMEAKRCSDNALYFANKYAYLQEPSHPTGRIKYIADEYYVHHKILCFLSDCGYSLILGKPRQIGSTSIFGIIAIQKTIFKINHFLKFITEDKDKGIEIFNDKILFTFSQMPDWMKPTVLNDRENLFSVLQNKKREAGTRKDTKRGLVSKIEVKAPTRTAINGGSPQTVYVDEIGSINILSEMVNEGRPTMFVKNRRTGMLEQRRQVVMWGCVCAGTKVWTNDGRLINIEDLKPEYGILGYDENADDGISKENITYWQPPVEKDCYRITLRGGRTLDCSDDHPILTSRADDAKQYKINGKRYYKKNIKFKETKDITAGDQCVIIDRVGIFGDKRMPDPRFIGWMIGDGNYGTTEKTPRRQPRFYNCESEINEYIDNHYDTTTYKQYTTKDGKIYKERNIRGIAKMLRDVGIYGQAKERKRLPSNIDDYCKDDLAEMIGGIFDTDGCVQRMNKKSACPMDLCSSSEEMLNEIKWVLHKFGIHCTIRKRMPRLSLFRKDRNPYYTLAIADKSSLKRFFEEIKFYVRFKQERLEWHVNNRCTNEKSRSKSKDYNHIKFETVKSVEYIGKKPVYNLTAGRTHTYIANGIVTHNTGTSERGGAAYEKEWVRITELFNRREASVGIVPLFLDWHTRCDEEHYLKEKIYYYGGRAKEMNMDAEISKVQFHQHYPIVPADMFVPTGKTLVSRDTIENNLSRIRTNLSNAEYKLQYGYFEPVYDLTQKNLETASHPYKIKGATFVPTDAWDERTTTEIFIPPDNTWRDRFYGGTDPINNETGSSQMATCIWDGQLHTLAAVTNCRMNHNPDFSYLQSMLLTLYYCPDGTGVPEIVERNISTSYRSFREQHGFLESLVLNAEVDPYFQSGAPYDIGIDNRGLRNETLIKRLGELVNHFGNRFYHEIVFRQLSTFLLSMTRTGKESWGSVDKRYYMDDVLFGLIYAYICCQSLGRTPISAESMTERKINTEYRLMLDANYNLKRVPINTWER